MEINFDNAARKTIRHIAAASFFLTLAGMPAQSADKDAAENGAGLIQLAHCCHAHPVYPYDQNCCHPPTTTYVAPAYGVGPASVRGTSRRTARRTSRRVSRRR